MIMGILELKSQFDFVGLLGGDSLGDGRLISFGQGCVYFLFQSPYTIWI